MLFILPYIMEIFKLTENKIWKQTHGSKILSIPIVSD